MYLQPITNYEIKVSEADKGPKARRRRGRTPGLSIAEGETPMKGQE